MFKQLIVILLVLALAVSFMNCEQTTMPEQVAGTVMESEINLTKPVVVFSRDTVEYNDVVSGECLDEPLDVDWAYFVISRVMILNDGRVHATIRIKPWRIIATGVNSGNIWNGVGQVPMIDIEGKVGHVYTRSGAAVWLSQNHTGNLVEPWTIHFTINAKGEVTVDKEEIRFRCN